LAEWIPTDEDLTGETIVSIDPNNRERVVASKKDYDSTVVGIVTTQPGWSIGSEAKDSIQMALAGRVPVRVTLKNGEIKQGDHITTSSISGVGMKATKAGSIVGKAMDSLNETSSLTDCQDPATGQTEKCGTILVFVDISWYDPDVYLTSAGGLQIEKVVQVGQEDLGLYELRDSEGNVIDRVGRFAELVVGNIRIGAATVVELVANRGRIDELETSIISPLADSDLVIDLTNRQPTTDQPTSGFGKLLVKGIDGQEVASIDAEGNATFSGTLAADKVETNEIVVGKIYADEIIARSVLWNYPRGNRSSLSRS